MVRNRSAKAFIRFLIIICVLCIIAIFLSLGVDGMHECNGEDCFICLFATLRESIINGLLLLAVMLGIFSVIALSLGASGTTERTCVSRYTPVGLKVKLSN